MWLSVVLTPGQTSSTRPSASCGYRCPLCPIKGRYSGKICFIEAQEANGHRKRVPAAPAAVRQRRARQNSRQDHVGIAEGSCGYLARGVSIRVKFDLSRNLEVKLQVRDLVRVLGIIALFAPLGTVPGKIR